MITTRICPPRFRSTSDVVYPVRITVTDGCVKRNKVYRYRVATITSPELSTAQLSAQNRIAGGHAADVGEPARLPAPARLPGGHRRYSEHDAEAVLEVLRLREQGLSLPAAIERARRQEQPSERSVFAGLRRRRPDLAATVTQKRLLVAISHAIEDEYLAHAGRGLVFGSFQRESSSTPPSRAGANWRAPPGSRSPSPTSPRSREPELAARPGAAAGPPPDGPRVDGDRRRAGRARVPGGWEHPSDGDLADHARRFEVIWSFEREIVRAASEVAAELLNDLAPEIAARVPDAIADGSGGDGLRFGSALAHRMVEYVADLVQGPSSRRRRPDSVAEPGPRSTPGRRGRPPGCRGRADSTR